MQVILKQDIASLGQAGAVVKVKDGFGRNFLLARGLALPLNAANIKKLEQEKRQKNLRLERLKKEAEGLKEKLVGLSLTIPVLTQEEDKIYGSIGPADLARALKEEGLQIDKDQIVLDEPIKSLGIYEVPITLHPEVSAKVKIWIVKK